MVELVELSYLMRLFLIRSLIRLMYDGVHDAMSN